MPRPKRETLATHEETLNPPAKLEEGQSLARVIKATGNNLYNVELPKGKTVLVELPARFRSTIWLKRGGYVLVDATTLAARENKIDGEIINIVGDEKVWRKMAYWQVFLVIDATPADFNRPAEFVKKSTYEEDDEDESTVGKMPPSDDDEDA